MTSTRPVGDRGERYPTPIANFDAWFKARCHEAATAKSRHNIDAALGMVQPYVDASWCLPERQAEIMAIAKRRARELDNNVDRKMAAAGDA